MYDSICKGCRRDTNGCLIKNTNIGVRIKPNKYVPEGLSCPCSTCLIKSMCCNDCDIFQSYYSIAVFCQNPSDAAHQHIFFNYLDNKYKYVKEYPPQIKSVLKELCK